MPLSPPPAPPLSRRSLLPVRVELAGRVRHNGAQRRGHRQRHRLPGVLRRFGFQGGAGQRDCQGPGEFPFLPPRRLSSSGEHSHGDAPVGLLGQQQVELQDGRAADVLGDHQARGDGATIRNQCTAAAAACSLELNISLINLRVVFCRTGRKAGRARCTCGATGATGSWRESEPTSWSPRWHPLCYRPNRWTLNSSQDVSFLLDVCFLLIFLFFLFLRVRVIWCVVQVVCGQNCSFLLQSNGTVLAVGEGQYGRLGQGNSDDLYIPTIISAFQGTVFDSVIRSGLLSFWCVGFSHVKNHT